MMNMQPYTADDDQALADVSVRGIALPRLAECALAAFLVLIFVGLSPFALRDAATLQAPGSGAGDMVRQLSYASVFMLIVYAAMREKGHQAFAVLPPVLACLLVWCLASAAWSAEPGVALRRAALEAVVVLSAMLSVSTVGVERSFQLWRWLLAAVLIVNWLSIPFVHQAVHLPGDPEPLLVGDWRGLYFHKNIAGAVSAITAIVFFFSAWEKRRPLDAAICIAAVAFTVMTRSKTSLTLLPVAIAAGAVYRIAWGHALDRMIVVVLAGLALFAAGAYLAIDHNAIARGFGDPTEFSGRTEIWQAELAFIKDHPYLGSGFGTFADTGALSPLHNYIVSNWVDNVSHGHNAYLQLLVTIGAIGFVLALIAFVFAPLSAFWKRSETVASPAPLLFAIFVFMVLHNFVESDFLEGDGAAWVSFLLMLGALRLSKQEPEFEREPSCPTP